MFQTAFPKAFAVAVALMETSVELWIVTPRPTEISETGSQTCKLKGSAKTSGIWNASRRTFEAKWTWLAQKSPTNSLPLSVLISMVPPSIRVEAPTVIVECWPPNNEIKSSIWMTGPALKPLRMFSDRRVIDPSCSNPVTGSKAPLAVI